jgi:adenylyltransferase/sulfurtransferase
LGKAKVLLVGCGALGCHLADQLARGGVGWIRLADRDVVEFSNLQRQTLFDESDAAAGRAKADAAGRRIKAINSSVSVEPVVADVWAGNIDELVDAGKGVVNLILDGTDNVQTRYLLNDAAVNRNIPWVHGACVGTEGRVMPIVPGGACLRCVYPTPPPARELPTCDTAGVLQSAAAMVASMQMVAAIKILTGQFAPADQRLWSFNVWSGRFSSIALDSAKQADCPCCGRNEFPFLLTSAAEASMSLCGRNAVQIQPPRRWTAGDFERVCDRLAAAGELESGPYFSRCRLRESPQMRITCFRDGRLLIDGTADAGRAKALCARLIGA